MEKNKATRICGLTAYGMTEWLRGLLLAALCSAAFIAAGLILHQTALSVGGPLFCLILWAVLAAFFRDPERKIPADEHLILAPADGVVRDIEKVPPPETDLFKDEDEVWRVGIFLSVLDVHLNRAPCKMVARETHYREGFYHDARNPKATKENEAQLVVADGQCGAHSFPVAIRQISGAIARRIVCPVKAGYSFEAGERYGMIKFGSRTELYIPARPELNLTVSIGDKVRGGATVMAAWGTKS